jgi:hypothetical protein
VRVSLRVAIHDADGGKYPNLALLKLAAWHRARGDTVESFIQLMQYDNVYSRWVNLRSVFKSTNWHDYIGGFKNKRTKISTLQLSLLEGAQ